MPSAPRRQPTEEQARRFIGEMLEAIRLEKETAKARLRELVSVPALELGMGLREVAEPGANHYRFECDTEVHLPEGLRAQLELSGGLRASAEVLDFDPDDRTLRLVVRDDLGEQVRSAWMSFDPTGPLDALALRLQAIADMVRPTQEQLPNTPRTEPVEPTLSIERALAFLNGSAPQQPPSPLPTDGLSHAQHRAVSFVLGQEVAYLWGPPGTGKTQAVAHLVHALLDRGERVLLSAHTNIATDTALERVLTLRQLPAGDVVRVGPADPRLRPYGVGLDDLVELRLRAQPGLAREVEQACRDLARGRRRAPGSSALTSGLLARRLRAAQELLRLEGFDEDETDALQLKAQLAELGLRLDAAERETLANAKLVATTLTRLYSQKRLHELRPDALVVDEASVASVAQCFVAASMTRKRAIAVGDFMQLPAIVQAEQPVARAWLGRHVFATAGCDRADRDHPLRAMLDEQWRMPPAIARVVSALFYAGRLHDSPSLRARPPTGPAMLLLDTGGLSPRTEESSAGSKRNTTHVEVVRELVERVPGRSIAVIAPYRAQVRAIRDSLRNRGATRLETGEIEVFTVHRFQGREKPLVVLDLVEAPGTVCNFLNETRRPEVPNLLNVALSRSMEQLVLVGDFAHLTRALGRGALVSQLLARIRTGGGVELRAGSPSDAARLQRFLEGAG